MTKMSIRNHFLLLSFVFLIQFPLLSKDKKLTPVYTIAFGSCMDQTLEKPIWKEINAVKPRLWIWLGDNIYKDTEDMAEKKTAYDLQKNDEGYQSLKKMSRILGVWDDHDYGYNDVGDEFVPKIESKELYLDFFEIHKSSPMRKRAGTYSSETITDFGLKIKIILLDTRTFRTSMISNVSSSGLKEYLPNSDPNASILGKEQWLWLESEFDQKADIYFIVSSIQVLNDTHRFEKWSNFPLEREKLLRLIDIKAPGKTFILSGDRHIAEVFEEKLKSGNTLVDFTSSSLNKPIPSRAEDEKDDRRVSEIYPKENFGFIQISKKKKKITLEISVKGISEIFFSKAYEIKARTKK